MRVPTDATARVIAVTNLWNRFRRQRRRVRYDIERYADLIRQDRRDLVLFPQAINNLTRRREEMHNFTILDEELLDAYHAELELIPGYMQTARENLANARARYRELRRNYINNLQEIRARYPEYSGSSLDSDIEDED